MNALRICDLFWTMDKDTNEQREEKKTINSRKIKRRSIKMNKTLEIYLLLLCDVISNRFWYHHQPSRFARVIAFFFCLQVCQFFFIQRIFGRYFCAWLRNLHGFFFFLASLYAKNSASVSCVCLFLSHSSSLSLSLTRFISGSSILNIYRWKMTWIPHWITYLCTTRSHLKMVHHQQ